MLLHLLCTSCSDGAVVSTRMPFSVPLRQIAINVDNEQTRISQESALLFGDANATSLADAQVL